MRRLRDSRCLGQSCRLAGSTSTEAFFVPAVLQAFAPISLVFLLSGMFSSGAFAANQPGDATGAEPPIPVPSSVGAGSSVASTTSGTGGGVKMLQGKAESISFKDRNFRAWQSSQFYQQGALALDRKNFKLAADLFKRAGNGFDMEGSEKFQAESLFAEAQSRRLLGQTDKASKLYQAAIDLFNEYDPLSPYLKAALDNLKKVSPSLAAQVSRDEARLKALTIPTSIMRVDRNVVLKGGLSDFGSQKLLAQKATSDVQSDYVNKTVHKAFVKMTCLETAELGSNSITAENRWYPLIANGRTVAIGASSDFLAPSISIKINERFYNVAVELPEIGSTKRTVFLLTDGNHIVAIEPSSEDMWSLVGDFKHAEPTFTWKKLKHFKKRKPV